jgi:hypothetical protein
MFLRSCAMLKRRIEATQPDAHVRDLHRMDSGNLRRCGVRSTHMNLVLRKVEVLNDEKVWKRYLLCSAGTKAQRWQ